jgi:ATP-dependent helicase Lhr and Lhr-like helicase
VLQESFAFCDGESLPIVRHGGSELRLWTFAGGRANAALAAGLARLGLIIEAADNFSVRLAGDDPAGLARALDDLDVANLHAPVPASALAKLKFSACLPEAIAQAVLTARLTDNDSVQDTLARPRRLVAGGA